MKHETLDDFITIYGIKHTAIAKALGVPYQTWSNHRHRRYKSLSIENINTLASFFRLTPGDVFNLTYKAYINSVADEIPTEGGNQMATVG